MNINVTIATTVTQTLVQSSQFETKESFRLKICMPKNITSEILRGKVKQRISSIGKSVCVFWLYGKGIDWEQPWTFPELFANHSWKANKKNQHYPFKKAITQKGGQVIRNLANWKYFTPFRSCLRCHVEIPGQNVTSSRN